MELSELKVCEMIGLLLAPDVSAQKTAGLAGHWVLRCGDQPNVFVAFNPQRPKQDLRRFIFGEPLGWDPPDCWWADTKQPCDWAREHLVVHSSTHRPFTSDYDLAAVVPWAAGWKERNEALFKKTTQRIDPRSGDESSISIPIKKQLNNRFGDPKRPRIMHGPQSVHSGRLANKVGDIVLAFTPDKKVWAHEFNTDESVNESVRMLRWYRAGMTKEN